MNLNLNLVKIENPNNLNFILGQSHFIKTVEDIHEICVTTNPTMKFGLAFSEASGDCLIRKTGNSDTLIDLAVKNLLNLKCGHSFILFIENGYPINILNRIKDVPEVCNIYCATANPTKVITTSDNEGAAILGVIDGFFPKGVENDEDIKNRKSLLRTIGYKL
jgi:adenosine/AMP kinase